MEALDRCKTTRTPVFLMEDVWRGMVKAESGWRVRQSPSGGWVICKSSCATMSLMTRLS